MKLNPFPTRDYIGPEYFCDRRHEMEQLLSAIENQRHITLISQRKMGKTALIKHLFYTLNKRNDISVHYFDIYPTQNLKDFTNQLCNSLIGYFESRPEKVVQKLIRILGQFRPKLTLDEFSGKPGIELDLQTESEARHSLMTLFNYLSEQEKQVVIAIDEFQQITQYPESNVEAILRSHIQGCNNISMIYSGSNRHMLTNLFNDYARPFYQSSGFLFLERLNRDLYFEFITGHFKAVRRIIADDALNYLYEWTTGITYFVQEVCNRLYSTRDKRIGIPEVNAVLLQIMEERTPIYLIYRDMLTRHQFNLLIALSKEVYTDQPTSSWFLAQHNLGAASSVKRSLEALINKNLICQEDGKYSLQEVFLMRWLQRYF